MLHAAVQTGRPLVAVAILDPVAEAWGAAPKWRWGEGLRAFGSALAAAGLPLTLRRGDAGEVLARLADETGAEAVWWSRAYDPEARARDIAVKAALRAQGLSARSFPGHLLFEPEAVGTKEGAGFRVFSAFWRAAVRGEPGPLVPAPARLKALAAQPGSEALADWRLDAALRRGAGVLARHCRAGEAEAMNRLSVFLAARATTYPERRDFPAEDATSELSEYLAVGEISPRMIWHSARASGAPDKFLTELGWREFAYHLLHHFPALAQENWNRGWDRFGWRADNADAEAWRRGLTGEPFVDAGLRQMFVTGRMHNRVRMVAASYLTKHLLTDWRVGLSWFADCLTDWDPASNALGWQWVAGSGPDAAPYFRVFNPMTQGDGYDPTGAYRQRWIAESQKDPGADALDYFEAAPRSWHLDPSQPYPSRRITPEAGRARALAAHAAWKSLKLLP